jgi:hypothetical protein
VVGGHRQQHGTDFDETFAPVCSYRSVRMLLAVSAGGGLVLRQYDIRTAFLNVELEEEVFIRAPAGTKHLAGACGRVLRLRSALYGLRQAPRAWSKRLKGELRSRGFAESHADPLLWIKRRHNGIVLSMFYVEDGLVAAHTAAEADALVELVGSIFEIRALSKPEDFLGINISWDFAVGAIIISQESQALALATQLCVTGSWRALPTSPETFAGLRARGAHG